MPVQSQTFSITSHMWEQAREFKERLIVSVSAGLPLVSFRFCPGPSVNKGLPGLEL